jgi:hypothetical protein
MLLLLSFNPPPALRLSSDPKREPDKRRGLPLREALSFSLAFFIFFDFTARTIP